MSSISDIYNYLTVSPGKITDRIMCQANDANEERVLNYLTTMIGNMSLDLSFAL